MTLKAKKRPHLHDTSQTVHSSEKTMILQYLILLWYSIIFGKYKHNGWNSAFGNKKSTQSTPHSWYAITETSYICFDMRAFRVKKEMKQTENHHTSHHNLRIFLVFSSVQVRRNYFAKHVGTQLLQGVLGLPQEQQFGKKRCR